MHTSISRSYGDPASTEKNWLCW